MLIITTLQSLAPAFIPPDRPSPVSISDTSALGSGSSLAAAASSSVPPVPPAALATPHTTLTRAQLAAANAALPPLQPQRIRFVAASVSGEFYFNTECLFSSSFLIRCLRHHHHLILLFSLKGFNLLLPL